MDTNKPANPFVFAFILTFVVALVLSLMATNFKVLIKENKKLNEKKYILESVRVDVSAMSDSEIFTHYNLIISELFIDTSGNSVDVKIDSLDVYEDKKIGSTIYTYNGNTVYPLYTSKDSAAVIIPISGKGLWSTLYGYFVIDSKDMNTVTGITFYDHGETPGLGAVAAEPKFTNQFRLPSDTLINPKQIFDYKGNLVSIKVIKGKADKNDMHVVNGISGATVTSDGITDFLKRDLEKYKPYFDKEKIK